jgi:hypothetical protein
MRNVELAAERNQLRSTSELALAGATVGGQKPLATSPPLHT